MALVLFLAGCSNSGNGQYVVDADLPGDGRDARPTDSITVDGPTDQIKFDTETVLPPLDVVDVSDLPPDLSGELDSQDLEIEYVELDSSDSTDTCGVECIPPEPLWAIALGGEMADVAISLAVDPSGAVYAGGHTNSTTIQVAGEIQAQIPADDIRQVFISRLLPDGVPDWTRALGGEGDDRLRAVAPRAAGGVLAAGFTGSTNLMIGEKQFSGAGKFDAWAASLADDGKIDWAISFGGDKDEVLLSIEEDGEGNVFLGGYFASASVQVGELTLTNTLDKEQYDLMVIKLDPQGTPIWARVLGGTGFDYVHSLAADADGSIYFLGSLSGAGMTFGEDKIASAGARDVLVGSYSADGTPRWIRRFGGSLHDAGHALAVSPAGDVYITGSLQSPVMSFGGDPIEHVGAHELHDIFLARLTSGGDHVWSHGFGGVDWDLAKCVALGQDGELYMVGSFMSPVIKLGGEALVGGGPAGNKSEVFVAAYDLDGSHRWSQAMGSPDHDVAYWVATGGPGVVAVAGTFNSTDDDEPTIDTIDLGTGPLPTYQGRDAFVARLK